MERDRSLGAKQREIAADIGGDDAIETIAERDGREPVEALNQERGAHEQHERHGDLRHNQAGAQSLARVTVAGLSAAIAHRLRRVPSRGQRRRSAKCNTSHDRDGHHEGKDSAVDRDLPGSGREPLDERGQHADRQPGEPKPEHAAGDGDQHALRQQLPEQPATAGAERRAERELTGAPHGPRERQVGDIRAREQKHQSRGTGERIEHRAGLHDERILEHARVSSDLLQPRVVVRERLVECRGDRRDL